MLWPNGKKIDTAFRRLRDRRAAVGIESQAETPEQEVARIKREIIAAQAAGDISTIVRLIAQTSGMTADDFINKTCGSLLYMYYTYLDVYHQTPIDIDDFIDGILYLDAKHYVRKQLTKGK